MLHGGSLGAKRPAYVVSDDDEALRRNAQDFLGKLISYLMRRLHIAVERVTLAVRIVRADCATPFQELSIAAGYNIAAPYHMVRVREGFVRGSLVPHDMDIRDVVSALAPDTCTRVFERFDRIHDRSERIVIDRDGLSGVFRLGQRLG